MGPTDTRIIIVHCDMKVNLAALVMSTTVAAAVDTQVMQVRKTLLQRFVILRNGLLT